jgi:hypothetical protein
MGMVSRGPDRRRFKVLARGGVELPSKPIVVRSGELYGADRGAISDAGSGLTTTMGGAFAGEVYLRSVAEETDVAEEFERAEEDAPWEVRE